MWHRTCTPTIYDCSNCHSEYNELTMYWKGGSYPANFTPSYSYDGTQWVRWASDASGATPSRTEHTHEWVDIGFTHSRWVCKTCNIEQPKQ